MFADEPTGNLDSTTSGEILDLLQDSVATYGQTTVMVTHDAHAAAIADRVLFLADGLIEGSRVLVGPRHLGGDGSGEWAMIGVTLKGLLGRKLRTFLTALAVVIGVAMVSGAYVLTDTMVQKAFDGHLRGVVRGHGRRHQREEDRRLLVQRARDGFCRPARRRPGSAQRRSCRGRDSRPRSQLERGEARRRERQGDGAAAGRRPSASGSTRANSASARSSSPTERGPRATARS